MSRGSGDLQSKYEFNSAWADRIALLIVVGLAVDILAVFILEKSWSEAVLAILANTLIILGVWGELLFARRAKDAGDGIVAEAQQRVSEANAAAIKATENAAKATERTAELSLALEDARAQTLRLSQGIARHVSPAQAALLKSLLAGKHFRLRMLSGPAPEQRQYRDELANALAAAGQEITGSGESTAEGATGVDVYGAPDDDATGADLANILSQANVRAVSFRPKASRDISVIRVGANQTVP